VGSGVEIRCGKDQVKLPAVFVVTNWKEFLMLCSLVITCIGCWMIFPTEKHVDKEFMLAHHCEAVTTFRDMNRPDVVEYGYICHDGYRITRTLIEPAVPCEWKGPGTKAC
jgi:hypothetical protein